MKMKNCNKNFKKKKKLRENKNFKDTKKKIFFLNDKNSSIKSNYL